MPSPLKFYRNDPIGRGRGMGYYYKRGGYKRGWMSKYDGMQDGSYRPKQNKPSLSRSYEHTGDRNRQKMTRHGVKKSPKKYVFMKGFF